MIPAEQALKPAGWSPGSIELSHNGQVATLEHPIGPADRYRVVPSPIGDLSLTGNATQLLRLSFLQDLAADLTPPLLEGLARDDAAFPEAAAQLDSYFRGELEDFDLTLAAGGNSFQHNVWEALLDIRYGETASYGQIATAIGMPGAARAVGAANHVNPLAIVVPCHRVIGSDGSLVGYGGGLATKIFLLTLEAQTLF